MAEKKLYTEVREACYKAETAFRRADERLIFEKNQAKHLEIWQDFTFGEMTIPQLASEHMYSEGAIALAISRGDNPSPQWIEDAQKARDEALETFRAALNLFYSVEEEKLQRSRPVPPKREETPEEREARRQAMMEVRRRLPERKRTAYIMRQEGKTFGQIGVVLNVSRERARYLFYAARRDMQRVLCADVTQYLDGVPPKNDVAYGVWHTFSWGDGPEPFWHHPE